MDVCELVIKPRLHTSLWSSKFHEVPVGKSPYGDSSERRASIRLQDTAKYLLAC